jgi:hypothetical protein
MFVDIPKLGECPVGQAVFDKARAMDPGLVEHPGRIALVVEQRRERDDVLTVEQEAPAKSTPGPSQDHDRHR